MAQVEAEKDEAPSVYNQVVNLINEANVVKDQARRLHDLRKVQELIIYKDSNLLDNFLDEMLGFQHDSSPEIRTFIVSFIEAACAKDADVLSKIAVNLAFLMSDQNSKVRKRVMSAMANLYPLALKWVSKTRLVSPTVESSWETFVQLKNQLVALIDSDNDGIQNRALNFLEAVIIAQSCKPATMAEFKPEEMCLNLVPRDHRFISYRRLEAEAKTLFLKLLQLLSSQVSSMNLTSTMQSLTRVAKRRPEFIEKVVLAFETIHVNLPPNLARSQVCCVRKLLKSQLLGLLKHHASSEYQVQITTLLTDLGATQVQVLKALPSDSDLRKRMLKTDDEDRDAVSSSESPLKRTKTEERDDEEDDEDSEESRRNSAINITTEFLYHRLTPENVTDLVLVTMVVLPDTMPPLFQSSYTPIAAAGTEGQIRHLAHLMATQFANRDLLPGLEQISVERIRPSAEDRLETPRTNLVPPTVPSFPLPDTRQPTSMVPPVTQTGKTSKRLHQFGLAHITKMKTASELYDMTVKAFERIMNAEKRVLSGGASVPHMKILVSMACHFNIPRLQEMLEEFILSDQKQRAELAILWIYHEYSSYQGFNQSLLQDPEKGFEKYDSCLTRLLSALLSRGEHRESLFHRIFLEAPQITPNAINIVKQACTDPVHGSFGLTTLREMILTRLRQRKELLFALIDFTCYEKTDLRHQSLEITKELLHNPVLRESVLQYVTMFLRYLLLPSPPDSIFGAERGRPENPGKWDEQSIKACLYLYLFLLPEEPKLIHQLANVYNEATGEIKLVILRQIEAPIKVVGMHSPELLTFVERCPKGAETLVTRLVHVLTERNPPTSELVKRVRDLYHERVPDVRFLIPVLTGLSRKEILVALPKLIRLNPNVLREVINRLLHGKSLETGHQPMSPSELLIAFHQIDTSNTDDMKCVITATNMLLSDRHVFTKEVLAGVIQQLVDQQPLPMLLMRTVIQALTAFPALIGFVMNMLQRLIMKQVIQMFLIQTFTVNVPKHSAR
ncbi:unnamed protein product [Soboliphyme baturini]|uniref:DUF3453 domain-containing protein n=1 Tax=Soboliphyme baturini TaxID=241478 RepID=A0A183IRS5_9BILA|nr:unnamed protein product [Soboliphyme baturini]